MSLNADTLYALLPAVYRLRDAEQGEPLRALLTIIAEQGEIVEEDLAQLYDDQFIETCADWVVPYLGDLIGYRALHSVVPAVSSPRAEVANTIGYRRRKGTATALEQMARDVTGWPARVVEYFQRLATTQYMNHLRPDSLAWVDLRQWEPLERLNTAFETATHTVDVRRIASQRGRYNIPNLGIVLWRLTAYPLTRSPLYQFNPDDPADRRYLFNPLGQNTPLFTLPRPEPEMAHLATPLNVPMAISRRVLATYLEDYYGTGKSLVLEYGLESGRNVIPAGSIRVCNLCDRLDAAGRVVGWAHDAPGDRIALDPELGRLIVPASISDGTRTIAIDDLTVRVTYHYGFSADLGGGEYDRLASIDPDLAPVQVVTETGSIQTALNNAVSAAGGAVEIRDSGRYTETLSISVGESQRLDLRAANRHRPTLILENALTISGGEDSTLTLNGLLVSGGPLRVTCSDATHCTLRLRHCTLVPGLAPSGDGTSQFPDRPSLIIPPGDGVVELEIDHCIVGGLRIAANARVRITNSIVDATAADGIAYSAPDGSSAGGSLQIENSTVIGRVHTVSLEASNTIFLSQQPPPSRFTALVAWLIRTGLWPILLIVFFWALFNRDWVARQFPWPAPVRVQRRQQGCVRFSYVPLEAWVPRRYRCQPAAAAEALRVRPQFTSLRYGDPGYGQLSQRCAVEIRQGADDEAEMGAFHDLYQPQRETNLRVRLAEYLRFGLEAGIVYAT